MFYLRDFWRRHKRKIWITVGAVGGGYALYKLYAAHRNRLDDLERGYGGIRGQDEPFNAQASSLQTHFETIQRIPDSVTLPDAIYYLQCRVEEELDPSHLTKRLKQEELTRREKLELWESLKILSFTRTALSLWSVTILTLYVGVQVNVLGRHIYIDEASLASSQILDEDQLFDRHSQEEFLKTAGNLSNYAMSTLISNMQKAVAEVLKDKHLHEPFDMAQLPDTITQILARFMSIGGSHYWVTYLLPEQLVMTSSSELDSSHMHPEISKLEQLMGETRAVLLSPEFENVLDVSLKKVAEQLMEELGQQSGAGISTGVPLARLLAGIAQLGSHLLEEPSQNRFIHIIQTLPEVELFCTLLYTNTPF